jgi:hypothetical protein
VFGIIANESGLSRNSGYFNSVNQKFCGGPEFLDQIFYALTKILCKVPEPLDTVFWVITKESGRSRSSEYEFSENAEILCWSRNSGPVRSTPYRNVVNVTDIQETVFWIMKKAIARFRTSGQGVRDHCE